MTSTAFANPAATWNRRFAEDVPVRHRAQCLAARARRRLAPGQRVLSVADGEGRNSVWLARQGLAVTPSTSPVGVDKARRLAGEPACR